MSMDMSVFAGDPARHGLGMVFLIAFLLAVMVLVYAYGFKATQKRRRAYARVSEFLRQNGKLVDGTPTVHHENIDFTLRFFGQRRQQPAGVWILSSCQVPGTITVRKKSRFDKRFRYIGFGREILTGDAVFDDRFCVTASKQAHASVYLGSVDVLGRIIMLFDIGFRTLKLGQNRIGAKLVPLTVMADKDPAFLLEAMECMADLIEKIPGSGPISQA